MHPALRYKAMTAAAKLAAMRTSVAPRAARALALALVVLAGIAGCAGDAPPDTEHSCTGELYDSCLQEHECMSNNCRSFAEPVNPLPYNVARPVEPIAGRTVSGSSMIASRRPACATRTTT